MASNAFASAAAQSGPSVGYIWVSDGFTVFLSHEIPSYLDDDDFL